MPHDHSSSKQSRLGVRANPLGTSTPSQKPLLRLLRAAGRWLEGAAWSWAWVAFSEARSTAGVPGCPRRARREIFEPRGQPLPSESSLPPLRILSRDAGELLGRAAGRSGAAVQGDGRHPRCPRASCQPLLLARCRLQHLAGSHVTRCWLCHPLPAPSPAADQGSHLSPCRQGRYKPRKLFKVFVQQPQSCRDCMSTANRCPCKQSPRAGMGRKPPAEPGSQAPPPPR